MEVGLDRSVEKAPESEFGCEIGAIQRVVSHQRITAAYEAAHAQYTIMIKGGECKKSDAGADENSRSRNSGLTHLELRLPQI